MRFGLDSSKLKWWFVTKDSAVGLRIAMPLWIPAAVSLLLTALAFRLDTLARRRVLAHLCPNCHYDRTGLAASAVCPECGREKAAP